MPDPKMDLMIRIRADAAAAKRNLAQVAGAIGAVGTAAGKVGAGVGRGFRLVGDAVGIALRPLQLAAKGALVAGGAFVALETKALAAAAADERLAARMAAVYGSATEANKVLGELDALSRRSAFSTDSLAEAMMILRGRNLDSTRTLSVLAAAATAAGMGVEELTAAVAAGQPRALKRLGIDVEEKDGRAIIRWTDSLRRAQTVVAGTDADKVKALMDALSGKFGAGVAPRGLSDAVKMLRNNLEQAFAAFGRPLLKGATSFVALIADKLGGLIEGGKLEAWGKIVADKLLDAADTLIAAFQTGAEVWDELRASGPKAMLEVFSAVFGAAGKILVVSFVEYLKAATAMFIGLGKLIASGMIGALIQTDLPGMGMLRENMSRKALQEMSPEERKAFNLSRPKGETTKEFQVAAATAGLSKGFAGAVEQVVGAAPKAMARVAEVVQEAGAQVETAIDKNIGGARLKQRQAANKAFIQSQREILGARMASGGWEGALATAGAPAPAAAPMAESSLTMLAPRPGRRPLTENRLGGGGGALGAGHGTTVQVGHMTIRANSSAQMERAVLGAAGLSKRMNRWST